MSKTRTMTQADALKAIRDFLESLDPYEDGDGNYPCYHVDEEKQAAACKALDILEKSQEQ